MSSLIYLSRWRSRASYLISLCIFYDNLIGKLLSEEILIHVCSLQSFVSTQKATNKSECHLTRQEYGHCLFVVIVCAGTFTKQLRL